MRIGFEGLPSTIEIPDDAAFLEALRAAAPDWPFAEAAAEGEPVAQVRAVGSDYRILSPWHEGDTYISTTAVSAACSVVVDVISDYIDANPSRLCLHCGSVLLGGRLIAFPSQSRAGKSTLIARLAAAGCQVYGDDVLPLDDTDRRGICLGLAPRPRLPLPASAAPVLRSFVERHAGPGDDRYLYLSLGERLARRGATAPLGAIILLDRRDFGPARLAPAPRPETLKALIKQNFARGEPAQALLDRLHQLMNDVPRFALRYSDLDEAAELLLQAFSSWPATVEDWMSLPVADATPTQAGTAAEPGPALAAKQVATTSPRQAWRRNPDVKLHIVDGEAFLAGPDGAAIHHLNAVGTGLWNLLAEDICQDEAVAVLHGAFPDVDRAVIAGDVAALFDELAAAAFILREEDDGGAG